MSLNRWCCVLVALLGIALPMAAQSPKAQFLRQPLVFEPNRGQADSATRFLSHGNGHTVLLKNAEAVLTFASPAASVRMKLVGQNADAVMEGLDRQESVTNYLLGDDPSAWHSSVPQFSKVKYGNVYPGIDLIYYGNERQLEYDFSLSPHANPSAIQIEFEGAERLSIAPEGDLVLETRDGEVRHQRPVAYQVINGVREPVDARFVLKGKRARFEIGAYDRNQPLVIDPKFVWATYLGGGGDDQGNDLAIDADGNVYVTGATQESTAPDPAGVLRSPAGKSFQIFVMKINPAGGLVYSTYIGGTGDEEGHSIAVDPAGNIYVTGFTTSTDFPLVNAFQSARGGAQDAYVLKLNNDGNSIIYSTYLGGDQSDRGYGIAADASGNAIVAGNTLSTNFPVSNAFQSKIGGGLGDGFVARFTAGGMLASSTFLGGSGNDQIYDVARDDDGNIVVTGFTTSQNFPTQNALYATYRGGGDDIFITKFNASASSLVFSTYFGGTGSDNGVRLTVDKDKNIYVTGYTTSLDFPLKNPPQVVFGGIGDLSVTTYDAFLLKLHPDGQDADFSTYIGGEDTEGGVGVAVDKNGFVYLAGYTNSLRFYAINALGGFLRGARDGFVMKISPDAQKVVYSSYLGGFGVEGATSIVVDDAGNAYLTGYTSSFDFPLAVDTMFQGATAGGQDGFLVKINADDIQTSTAFTFPANGGASVFTAGQTANPVFGYAAADVASGLSPSGLEVVDLRSGGTLVNEVGVPAPSLTYTGRVYAKTDPSDSTAISMVNPGVEEVNVDYYFTSSVGETSMFGSFKLPAKGQFSALLTSQPFNLFSGIEGTLTFTSSGPVAAIALRVETGGVSPVNLYLPIIDPYTANDHPLVMPEFVDGGGWTTEFQLINPTEYTVTGEIRLFKNTEADQPGVPAEIATEKGVDSVFSYSIPPRGLYKLVGLGESGDTSSGYADIVPLDGSSAPLAYATVSFSSDTLLATTVEAVEPGSSFRMYVESSGTFPEDLAATPAIALANSTDSPATVHLSLTGFDGTSSGLSAQVTIPPRSRIGRFLIEIPGFEHLPSPYSGVLTATTSDPGVTFAGFRTRYNEQRQFLMMATGPLKDLGSTNPVIFPHLVDGGGYATQFILLNGTAGGGATGAVNYRDPSGNFLNVAIAP